MNLIQKLEAETVASRLAPGAADVRTGDVVRVHAKIIEGDKARVQIYEGMVIRVHRGASRGTVTVRKVSNNVGVERIFPICSPNVAKFEVVTRHKVRRAKLHFLRSRKGKAARLKPLK
jgi:large subunit ribosomal protein L19